MKKLKTILLTGVLAVSIVGCGNSGVSQEEYDKVVKERDEYKAQLEAAYGNEQNSEEKNAENEQKLESAKEFKTGETWEVEGKFRVTVNSVVASDYRNEYSEKNPAAVYIINYTYENLGLNEELYVDFESKIVDNLGKMGTTYPGNTDKYPQYVPIGANCEAEACVAVDNAGSFKDYVSIYDDEYNEHRAIFNLDIQ